MDDYPTVAARFHKVLQLVIDKHAHSSWSARRISNVSHLGTSPHFRQKPSRIVDDWNQGNRFYRKRVMKSITTTTDVYTDIPQSQELKVETKITLGR